VPAASVVVVNCAEPAASIALPICAPPSRNMTVPVGVPEPDAGAMCALNVTPAPVVICDAEAESDVVVAIFAGAETTMVTVAESEAAKFASPEYDTVIEWVPAASVPELNDAAPATSAGIASCVGPSRTVTVPVGVPLPELRATEILSVSVWPVVSCVVEGETDVVVAIFAGAVTVTATAADEDAAKFESPE
jgi:hypothetical protein